MGLIKQHQLSTFSNPVNGVTPIDANLVRGNDNTIKTAYNAHDADTTIHVQNGAIADRPTFGIAGRMWLSTDTGAVYGTLDTGAAWVDWNYLKTSGGTVNGEIIVVSTSTSLRLAYDGTNVVDFAVTSVGGLTITPMAGQVVSVTGFTASGAASLSGQTRVGDLFRVESVSTPSTTGLAGAGVEITYDPTNKGTIKSFDYGSSLMTPLRIVAASLSVVPAATFSDNVVVSNAALQGVQWGVSGPRIRWDGSSYLEVTNTGATGYVNFGVNDLFVHGKFGANGTTPVAKQVSGGTLAGVIAGLVASGLFSS